MEHYIGPMPQISLVTASFVTRELGYGSMADWSEGDTATQQFFAPVDSYPERIDELLGEIADLGFRTIDLWGAHLHYSWASEDHFEAIRSSLDRYGIGVNSLAAWCTSVDALEGFCRVANEVGATIIGGGSPLLTEDRATALGILEAHGVRFAIENHPEKSTSEVLSVIGDSELLGSCADSGWWAIQGVNPPTAFRELGDRILTVHLKDVNTSTGKGMRPGTGSADVLGCLQALSDIGYEGAVGIEHEPDGWDPTEDLQIGYKMLQRWVADKA
jgi:sugar phosphate isomerase/epimerase